MFVSIMMLGGMLYAVPTSSTAVQKGKKFEQIDKPTSSTLETTTTLKKKPKTNFTIIK